MIEVQCLGGFALTVVYGISRSTGDIDYLTAIPIDSISELESTAGQGSALGRKFRVHFQHIGGIPDVPENYDERLLKLELDFAHLDLRILDPYDLCLSKLTRNSPKDREDVKALAKQQKLNFSTFDRPLRKRNAALVAEPRTPRTHTQPLARVLRRVAITPNTAAPSSATTANRV
jgi:hypothetical protein